MSFLLNASPPPPLPQLHHVRREAPELRAAGREKQEVVRRGARTHDTLDHLWPWSLSTIMMTFFLVVLIHGFHHQVRRLHQARCRGAQPAGRHEQKPPPLEDCHPRVSSATRSAKTPRVPMKIRRRPENTIYFLCTRNFLTVYPDIKFSTVVHIELPPRP